MNRELKERKLELESKRRLTDEEAREYFDLLSLEEQEEEMDIEENQRQQPIAEEMDGGMDIDSK